MLSSTTVTYTPWDGLYASLGSGNALYIPSGGCLRSGDVQLRRG
jgi:hypothetical protein